VEEEAKVEGEGGIEAATRKGKSERERIWWLSMHACP
jgi:hypothetical protein